MARTMNENSVAIYRTIVRTTFLEERRHSNPLNHTTTYKAGTTLTEVFGPHSKSSCSRNYSEIKRFRLSDDGSNYIKVADQKIEHQKLTPVLALQPSGALTLDFDWVTYG